MRFFRSMLPDAGDGLPVVGDRKFMLGVRVPGDIEPAADGTVRPATGGMSVVAEDPKDMPAYLLPRGEPFRGLCKANAVVFSADEGAVVPPLQARPDRPPHHVVEPAERMLLHEFQAALGATRAVWSAE